MLWLTKLKVLYSKSTAILGKVVGIKQKVNGGHTPSMAAAIAKPLLSRKPKPSSCEGKTETLVVNPYTDAVVVDANGGMKRDGEKTRWDLLEWELMEEVADVMTFGAKKYDDYNWRNLDNARIFAAMMRHIRAHQKGEFLDDETGKSHLAHAACELMFLYWKEKYD